MSSGQIRFKPVVDAAAECAINDDVDDASCSGAARHCKGALVALLALAAQRAAEDATKMVAVAAPRNTDLDEFLRDQGRVFKLSRALVARSLVSWSTPEAWRR